jgi:hypothetical protein
MIAWFNFRALDELHTSWANPAILYRNDQWPQSPKRDAINATYFIAIAFGATSLYLFVASAAKLSQTLAVAFGPG